MRYCTNCGQRLNSSAEVCWKCGYAFSSEEAASAGDVDDAIRSSILVTTGDVEKEYDIIGPIYFQVSNKGLFSSQLGQLKAVYAERIESMRAKGQIGEPRADWGFLYGEWSAGQSDFEVAFYIAVQELQKRAAYLGADAVVHMRQDIDLDTHGFQFFYLQMYGTAVRYSAHREGTQ